MAASMRSPPEMDSDDEESGDWEEWQVTGAAEEDDAALCLFCSAPFLSPKAVFQHCAEVHSFDFLKLRADARLDFYDTLRLINFIRSKVAESGGWGAGASLELQQSLLKQKGTVAAAWKDDKFLTPFMENDPLLYSFDDEGEDDDELNAAEKTTALQELLEGTTSTEMKTGDLADVTKVFLSLGEELASPVDLPLSSDDQKVSVNGSEPKSSKKKDLRVTFAEVAKREARNVNKDYFGSYSAFGIHREMLSDKVRTDAYRDAIVANPSLLKNAVVMDVGCGTGILSLFAAQAGASKVIAVDGSSKMAAVATEIAKANGFLKDGSAPQGVMTVVSGMIEELDSTMPAEVHGVDVLVSEWMGKTDGKSFWENVYGFNMKCVGEEVVRDATQAPIIDVVASKDVITTSSLIQAFDLATMKADDTDFTAEFKLELLPSSQVRDSNQDSTSVTWCHGLVVWFDTGFTQRFCKEKPVLLSTSPHSSRTHWSQTILTFKEPIALCAHHGISSERVDKEKIGIDGCPASAITGRISIARSHRHRSIDISLETSAVSSCNAIRTWPIQMFDI